VHTISVANEGGSAGKTSSVVTLATLAALDGREVLIIDLDAQANASVWLRATEPGPTSGDVLLDRAHLAEAIVATDVPNLWLVPSSGRLNADALDLSARVVGGEQRLKMALDAIPTPGPDLVMIDCPGSMSVLTVAALVASDAVVTVAQPTLKELAGVPKLDATVAEVARAYRPGLGLGAVIPCIVPGWPGSQRREAGAGETYGASSGAVYSEALALLQREWGDLVTPAVRRSVRVPEAYAQQVPLPLHAPREPVTEDYRLVHKHLTAAGILP
jgi:chromosome partitioning protein